MSESVREALEAELAAMPDEVRRGSRSVLALRMAEAVDVKASAIMAKELAILIDRIWELAPPKPADDRMDALQAQRDKRRHSA